MKIFFLSSLASILIIFGHTIQAQVTLSNDPISAKSNGVAALLAKVKRSVAIKILTNIDKDTSSMDQYMECSAITEISGAYICVAFYQADLNNAFTRIGIFMGAGKGMKRGTLLKEDDWKLKNYKKIVAGHNMPGKTIIEFYNQVKESSSIKLNQKEQAFKEAFIDTPSIQVKKENFYVIGLSVQSTKSQASVASHEIFHAQYLLTPNYKKVVDDFWHNQITEIDKKKIKTILGKAYNTEDYIIIDEFQAYLIQDNAEKDFLGEFVNKYRKALISALAKAGVDIVRVASN
ncbi:hypothetical protein [Spartinivicinus ruber]|uniref:hypothetical protein n=1 Tax=Spartinivicinus ruber TaxID=2683272 RepID=UPI0013D31E96|nr:hypothetical protein [Spartinivicinus ruber]